MRIGACITLLDLPLDPSISRSTLFSFFNH